MRSPSVPLWVLLHVSSLDHVPSHRGIIISVGGHPSHQGCFLIQCCVISMTNLMVFPAIWSHLVTPPPHPPPLDHLYITLLSAPLVFFSLMRHLICEYLYYTSHLYLIHLLHLPFLSRFYPLLPFNQMTSAYWTPLVFFIIYKGIRKQTIVNCWAIATGCTFGILLYKQWWHDIWTILVPCLFAPLIAYEIERHKMVYFLQSRMLLGRANSGYQVCACVLLCVFMHVCVCMYLCVYMCGRGPSCLFNSS